MFTKTNILSDSKFLTYLICELNKLYASPISFTQFCASVKKKDSWNIGEEF